MKSEIRGPFDGSLVGQVTLASRAQIISAIDSAVAAAPVAQALPSHARAAALTRVRSCLVNRKEDLSRLLAAEAGKPLGLARTELDRTIFVFEQGIEEAKRMGGEVLPILGIGTVFSGFTRTSRLFSRITLSTTRCITSRILMRSVSPLERMSARFCQLMNAASLSPE